jgi:hypothetical protein
MLVVPQQKAVAAVCSPIVGLSRRSAKRQLVWQLRPLVLHHLAHVIIRDDLDDFRIKHMPVQFLQFGGHHEDLAADDAGLIAVALSSLRLLGRGHGMRPADSVLTEILAAAGPSLSSAARRRLEQLLGRVPI